MVSRGEGEGGREGARQTYIAAPVEHSMRSNDNCTAPVGTLSCQRWAAVTDAGREHGERNSRSDHGQDGWYDQGIHADHGHSWIGLTRIAAVTKHVSNQMFGRGDQTFV